MADIDEVKEILNTLRLFFSIGVGLVVVITGTLISKEQNGTLDLYFWTGATVDLLIIIGLIFTVRSIKKNTTKIKDL